MKRAVALLAAASFVAMGAGFLREASIAYFFGTTGDADSFALVMFYLDGVSAVVLTGIAGYLMVPVLSRVIQDRGTEEGFRLLETCILWVSIVGFPLLIIGFWRINDVTLLIAPEFDAARRATLVSLLYFALPASYLTLLSGVMSGVLQARRDYYSPVHGRTLFALSAAAFLFFGAPLIGIVAAGAGLLLGGLLQLAVQVRGLQRLGWRPQSPNLHHAALGHAISAGVPVLIALVLMNMVMGGAQRAVASGLPSGAFSSVNYAQRSLSLVSGLSMSLATVSLTELSVVHSASGVTAEALAMVRKSLETGFVLLLPLSLLLCVSAEPLVALLFRRGRYDLASVELTASCLRWLAASVVPGMILAVLHRAAPAFGRPWRSTVTSLIWTLATVGATILLLKARGAEALAAGFAIGTLVAALTSAVVLYDIVPLRVYIPVMRHTSPVVVISAAGLIATLGVFRLLGPATSYSPLESATRLVALGSAFVVFSLTTGIFLGEEHSRAILANALRTVRRALTGTS